MFYNIKSFFLKYKKFFSDFLFKNFESLHINNFISLNRNFFLEQNQKNDINYDNAIFIDVQTTDIYTVNVLMKIAKAVSKCLGKGVIVMPALKADRNIIRMIESYLPLKILYTPRIVVKNFILHFNSIISYYTKITTGEELIELKVLDISIGKHIYDALLRKLNLSTINNISFHQKILIMKELAFFYAYYEIFKDNFFTIAILPDNVYRHGVLFEILKVKRITCIAGIDVSGIAAHKYETIDDYEHHCRKPDEDIVKKIANNPLLLQRAEDYLEARTKGNELQHDVLKAYSNNNIYVTRDILIREHKLDPNKKIALVMAHIFCDAPHGYPNTLFKDYEQWLVGTCLRLNKNENINFLIKEHPSASLYNEKGKVSYILGKYNLADKILLPNINTKSLFHCIDVVITCGGTAGMEFPCYGVPVIVAANPPYSGFPYIIKSESVLDYYENLDRIHTYEKQSPDMIKLAKAVLYTIQSVQQLDKKVVGMGTQPFYIGYEFDTDLFLQEMINECITGNGFNVLCLAINDLLTGKYKNLIDYKKLSTCL